jgi:hypothetical protein
MSSSIALSLLCDTGDNMGSISSCEIPVCDKTLISSSESGMSSVVCLSVTGSTGEVSFSSIFLYLNRCSDKII